LAKTICEHILEANGGESPAAVFLVGGGSLITGLVQAVSDKLAVPIERVALGSQSNLKNITLPTDSESTFGAQLITPLGIAVTGALNKGYDFSTIMLNDKAVRIFDTNNVTVFELLSMAGYKSEQILGRSGRTLTYTLDGVRKTVRGGGFEPAVIKLSGKAVSLSAKVTGGDLVEFVPAVCGENARITLREAVPDAKDLLAVKVNDKLSEWNYEVQNLDKIEVGSVAPVAEIPETPKPVPVPKPTAGAVAAQTANALLTRAKREVAVKLNGTLIVLEPTADGSPHTFIELLNYVDMDFDNPPTEKAQYVTKLNGFAAGFSDTLKDGDVAELAWE